MNITKRPDITLCPCTSRQISGFGYHPETKTLAVSFKPRKGFKTGALYYYTGVKPETFEAFQNAESKGSFFGSTIKQGYAYEKISDGTPEDE